MTEPTWRYQQEDETNKAWHCFRKYRDMVHSHNGTRSLSILSEELGYKSTRSLEVWSVKYDWQDRVAEYDRYMSELAIVEREGSIADYQDHIIGFETTNASLAGRLIENQLRKMLEQQMKGDDLDSMDIKRLTSSLKDISELARRAAGMATSFRSEAAEEEDLDNMTFIIGGEIE